MNDIEKYAYIENEYGKTFFPDINEVYKLLDDSDECVRIEMIEACYACEQEEIHKKLIEKLETAKGLEKGYLLLTLAYIYEDEKEKIVPALQEGITSKAEVERLDSYIGLIILGWDRYLKEVLEFFNSSDYHLRCAAINLLSELIQNERIDFEALGKIKNALSQLDQIEKTNAVKSSINHLLEIINGNLQRFNESVEEKRVW